MRTAAIAIVLLGGCIYFDSEPAPMDAQPPGEELPAGVWEPMPGAWIWHARIATDGDTMWWAATRRRSPGDEALYNDAIWLAATTPDGASVVAPTAVAPDSPSAFDPSVVATPDAIIVKLDGADTLLRRYAHDGTALGDPYVIRVLENDVPLGTSNETLVAAADGHAQYVATLGYEMHEVAILDLDGNGQVAATTLLGARDTLEPGGSIATSVAAAARADGSTIIAWDRNYNGCISSKPSAALTTSIAGGAVAPIETVRDLPDSESRPVVATSGDAAFIAWQSYTANGARIALARYPDVTTVVAEVGDNLGYTSEFFLALAAPDRGAIAWPATDGSIHVTPFADRAGTLMLGTPTIVAPVAASDAMAIGLVHVGADRYVLGWIEAGAVVPRAPDRLLATQLDLADATLRPAPPLAPAPTEPRPSQLRCP